MKCNSASQVGGEADTLIKQCAAKLNQAKQLTEISVLKSRLIHVVELQQKVFSIGLWLVKKYRLWAYLMIKTLDAAVAAEKSGNFTSKEQQRTTLKAFLGEKL